MQGDYRDHQILHRARAGKALEGCREKGRADESGHVHLRCSGLLGQGVVTYNKIYKVNTISKSDENEDIRSKSTIFKEF